MVTLKFALKNIWERPKFVTEFDYDQYWQDKRSVDQYLSAFQLSRAECILPYLGSKSVVLDVGSGDGSVAKYISESSGCKIYCSDFSRKALDLLSDKGLPTISLDADSDYINVVKSNNIDTITYLEVLEHMPEPERVVLKALKSVDKVIFSIPNSGFISHRLRLMFGKFPMQWRLHPGEHLRFWTLSDLQWWCNQLGFRDFKIIPYEGFPILNTILPGLFSRGLVVIVKGHSKMNKGTGNW
jgi:2-polyprenyl-3-methyl-5-hydroxy-6-metoxy-1,4-benzoquinol methylase